MNSKASFGSSVRKSTSSNNEGGVGNLTAARAAATYFDKIERYELQETLAYTSSDWLLSTEDTKISVEAPAGTIQNIQVFNEYNNCLFLIPHEDGIEDLELREMHQITNELVKGIYVLNQTPSINLEANFDLSTACQLPPAYADTRVGQILTNIDYLMKSLWHGAYFPKDKRSKFAERWRQAVNLNSVTGEAETRRNPSVIWQEAGLVDLADEIDFKEAYSKLLVEDKSDPQVVEDRKIFMRHVNEISMILTVRQQSLNQFKNLFVVDGYYTIGNAYHTDKLDNVTYERLQRRLFAQEEFLMKNLANKPETRRQLVLLKFISFMVPFLIAMKKRCKIPDVKNLLPGFTFEECKTERELPPLVLSEDFKCKHFDSGEKYFHLHGGILIDRSTGPARTPDQHIVKEHMNIHQEALEIHHKTVNSNSPLLEKYPMKQYDLGGKKYYVLTLNFETYYSISPKQPLWVHAHYDEITKLKPKHLPLQDLHIHEQFRKRFGNQKTVKLKQVPQGLQGAAERGLIAIFYTLSRKIPANRLMHQDVTGLALIHYAAIHNNPQVITMLITMGGDVNMRRYNNNASQGETPLHFASRSGALDSLMCLLAFKADYLLFDNQGYAPIHYAAFFNHVHCILHLVQRQHHQRELKTIKGSQATPILLASSAGSLSAVKCLLELGALHEALDGDGNSIIHLATLHFHTNILEFFIDWKDGLVRVWDVLVEMLKSEEFRRKEMSAKCLEVLSLSRENNWQSILYAGGIPALVALLQTDSEELQTVAASVLCNIGEHEVIRIAVAHAGAIPVLIQLLQSPIKLIHSRAAVILADLACVESNQDLIAQQDGIFSLVMLLDSEVEHVLVNTVNCLRVLCDNNYENQTLVANTNHCIEILVELLDSSSKKLQANVAAALSAITKDNYDNQELIVAHGAVPPLVALVKSKNPTCQVKAASALQSLAENNPHAQDVIDTANAAKPLIKLLKMWAVETKEQGASALWALAGATNRQQQSIARLIGINILVDMLMMKSEKLQYIAAKAIIALTYENIENQCKIIEGGGILPLVRLLRSTKTSDKVLLVVIQVLGVLCVGVAHQSNKGTQKEIANAEAFITLMQLLRSNKPAMIRVEVAITLAKIVLNNSQIQSILVEQTGFRVKEILPLLNEMDDEIHLKAGMALATFAYNNTSQQYNIRDAGGINLSCFEPFLSSPHESYQAHTAFQIIILARVINDTDQVMLCARGVELLVSLLTSQQESTQILAASLLASLAHTRFGIPDAMIVTGVVQSLIVNLHSENDLVRSSAAVALGYLTFNRTAARELLMACRSVPGLFKAIETNLGSGKMSMEFVDEWRRTKKVGLPSQSLEVNGGPPIQHKLPPKIRNRPKTTQNVLGLKRYSGVQGRAASAPGLMQRTQRPKTSLGIRAHVPADRHDADNDANNPDRLPSVDSVQKRMRKIAF